MRALALLHQRRLRYLSRLAAEPVHRQFQIDFAVGFRRRQRACADVHLQRRQDEDRRGERCVPRIA